MKAVLLTAGLGCRLKPLTEVVPKSLLPIAGRPLLEYWFRMLRAAGIDSLLMNLHYMAGMMRRWVEGTEGGATVNMVFEEELLGTGGTLLRNRDFAGGDTVMLIHADNLCGADLRAFIDAHRNRPAGAEITMMTFRSPTPETCGTVTLKSSGVVASFFEKVDNPPRNLANAAVYIVEPSVIAFLASLNKPFIDFSTEVLPEYVKAGKVYTYFNHVYHRDIGNVASYLTAQIEFSLPQSYVPERDGSWESMCRKDATLPTRLMTAVTDAIDAEVLEPGRGLKAGLNKLESRRKAALLHFLDLDACLPVAEEVGRDFPRALAFIERVPKAFSSRDLYRETGLRSLAVYSVDKER